MSAKIWIDAKSKVWLFSEMTDLHVDSCIDWCRIRVRSLERQQTDEVDDRQLAIDAEMRRVRDLKVDLLDEQARRKKPVVNPAVAEITIRPTRDVLVNGQLMRAGEATTLHANAGKIELVEYRSAQPTPAAPVKKKYIVRVGRMGKTFFLDGQMYDQPKKMGELPRSLVNTQLAAKRFDTEQAAKDYEEEWSHGAFPQYGGRYSGWVGEIMAVEPRYRLKYQGYSNDYLSPMHTPLDIQPSDKAQTWSSPEEAKAAARAYRSYWASSSDMHFNKQFIIEEY